MCCLTGGGLAVHDPTGRRPVGRRQDGFGLYGRTVAYDSVFQMKMTKALTSLLPAPIRRRYFRQLQPHVRAQATKFIASMRLRVELSV